MLPTFLVASSLLMPIGSKFAMDKANPKVQLAFGSVLGLGCLLAATFMSDFLAFFVLYVAAFTIMQSTCYMVCIH
jgi:hypothetical protein